jgi:hypothetical protein
MIEAWTLSGRGTLIRGSSDNISEIRRGASARGLCVVGRGGGPVPDGEGARDGSST